MKDCSICRVGITGVYKLDLVLYCALVLQKMGYPVLVCDETQSGETLHGIRKPGKYMDLIRYKDIDFAFSDLVMLDEQYRYIFYLWDFGNSKEIQVQWKIFVCDGEREHIENLSKEWFDAEGNNGKLVDNRMVIYRNLYGLHGMEYLRQKGINEKNVEIIQCQHDCMDEACYQRMQYVPFTHITEMSADLEHCIYRILMNITGDGDRQVKKGIKMAKRGSAY